MSGLWSVFSLPTLTLPAYCSASLSMVGPSIRQGPHHTAQKSTRTGLSLCTTSFSQFAVVSSTTLALAIYVCLSCASRPGRNPCRGSASFHYLIISGGQEDEFAAGGEAFLQRRRRQSSRSGRNQEPLACAPGL